MEVDALKVVENYRNKLSEANHKIAMLEVYVEDLETALQNATKQNSKHVNQEEQ